MFFIIIIIIIIIAKIVPHVPFQAGCRFFSSYVYHVYILNVTL